MNCHRLWLGLAVAGLAAAGPGSGALQAQEQPLTRTDLVAAAIGAVDGIDVVSYIVDAAPGAEVPKHRHPGDEFLYVLDGAVTLSPEGSASVAVQAGEIFHLPYGTPHSAGNASESDPARILVFQVVEQGKPLTEPVE
ncbi:MAG TPA: cupin domain-containing protein [Thermohalobaculum sp.]|nr:cupin domain-containing protein [Thermohalobaculum sp.]